MAVCDPEFQTYRLGSCDMLAHEVLNQKIFTLNYIMGISYYSDRIIGVLS